MKKATSDWQAKPLATVDASHGGLRIAAVSHLAEEAGIQPGLPLATARAIAPSLETETVDPAVDRQALSMLADWCGRYTPWTAIDGDSITLGGGGLWLDISGCAHLFSGEEALLNDLQERLSDFGFANRAAVADTPGAAWAVARFAAPGKTAMMTIVPVGGHRAALAPLAVAGLRLPVPTTEDLTRLGLGRIGDLEALPRATLGIRFGETVLKRLDQALDRAGEPISPRRPAPTRRVRLCFAEAIARTDDVAHALRRLLADLCRRLETAHQGVRRLELAFFRVDGQRTDIVVGTGRPSRDPIHLERLFAEKLDGLDAGFGIETMILAAVAVDPLAPIQDGLQTAGRTIAGTARLIDRLGNRLGARRVMRLAPRASHLPERASRAIGAATPVPADDQGMADGQNRPRSPRPVHLLPWPEPVEVMAPLPDHPPVMFRWRRRRHRVQRADGPERIEPEWWLEDPAQPRPEGAQSRDYYRVEDSEGQRFWLYREGLYRPDIQPRWYLHGLFP